MGSPPPRLKLLDIQPTLVCKWPLLALPVLTYRRTLRSGSQKQPFSPQPGL